MQEEKNIPFWEQSVLTMEEASQYFRIGERKLRGIVGKDPSEAYVLWSGKRMLVKRKEFEKHLDEIASV